MTLSAAGIDALVAMGLTVDQLATVVKTELRAMEAAAEAKRERQRQDATRRQQRKREKDRASRMSRVTDEADLGDVTHVTRDSGPLGAGEGGSASRMSRVTEEAAGADVTGVTRDSRDATGSPDKKAPQTPKRINPLPHTRESAREALNLGLIAIAVAVAAKSTVDAERQATVGRYHRLPADWQPPAKLPDKLAAKVALWPPGKLEDEADAFRAWAANAANVNGKGKKLDWDQAWHNWLRGKHDDWQRSGGARGWNGGGAGGRSSVAAAHAVLERVHAAGRG